MATQTTLPGGGSVDPLTGLMLPDEGMPVVSGIGDVLLGNGLPREVLVASAPGATEANTETPGTADAGVDGGSMSLLAAGAADGGTADAGADGGGGATPLAAAAGANAIVLENQKQGNPQSEWDLTNGPSTSIEGFATDLSVDQGQTVTFKINTDSRDYRIDIYRLGYYDGMGARKVATVQHQAGAAIVQPDALVDPATGLVDAGNWQATDSWTASADAVSGIYIAKLVRQDGTAGENHIPFILRDDDGASDIVFQTADTTWQAYNGWGGANLYGGNGPATGPVAAGRSYAVSYNRPITTREGGGAAAGPQDFIFGAEYAALRWMEMNGYDVSYITGVDASRNGGLLLNHKIYTSVGHDEYWSAEQRANVEAARDAGVNLAFMSGNEVYWKTRWETSIDGTGTPYRTLVSYKETRAGGKIDPSPEWTGTWRDPSYDPSGGGGQPENGLTGTMFQVDSFRADAIAIPYPQTQLRFWRNTEVAATQPGDSATLVQNVLGYEWDISPDNGFRPDGLIKLSTTVLDVDTFLVDYGTTVGPGTATHNLTLYRAPSGALVFGAGTVYWSWGLDENHDLQATPTDPNIQQAMVNLFADMGVQPQTLQASLVLASRSTDLAAPTSTITTTPGSAAEGQRVTVSGTATDAGGLVGGVEVSTDGGDTWRAAHGTPNNWTYTFTTGLAGTYTVQSRAVDDSLNLETPGAGATLTVTPATRVTLFQPDEGPTPFPGADLVTPTQACCNACLVHLFGPTELGVKFQSARSGTVSGIRFYKDEQNTGTHTGSLWTVSGQLLAQATFTSETGSGWQQVNFAQPVTIAAGTTYVASYHTPTGVFLASPVTYFSLSHTSGPLTALASGWEHGPNGLIAAGPAGTFPTGVPQSATNYWVDLVFNPASEAGNHAPVAAADGTITGRKGATLTIAAATLLANDTDPDGDPLTITGVSGAVHGSVAYNTVSQVITFTPEPDYVGPAQFSYAVTDGRAGSASASVALDIADAPPSTGLFAAGATPAVLSTADGSAVEVGVRFQATTAGRITGLLFYKGAGNTGPHVGHLWTATGSLLATASFTNESASGWQQVDFAAPVAITAGVGYVASYHTTVGRYSSTPGFFAAPHVNGPLSAPAGGNGVFAYGPAGGFPTGSYNNTNYWVDVAFESGSGPNRAPVAVADAGFETSQGMALVIPAAALLGNDTDPDGDPLTITGVDGATHGSVAFDAVAQTITFTPEAGYAGPAGFTYSIADGRGGTATASAALSVEPPGSTFSLFRRTDTPAVASVNDPSAVEVGVRFQASAGGAVTGIRFYKGAGNTGPHVGHLWTATGTLLATASFTAETASGWQQVDLAAPVNITAGAGYVASYHTASGNYAASPGFFATPHASGPLSAPAGGNGVYAYGPAGGFPSGSFNNTNYWVDVVFDPRNRAPVAVADDELETGRDTALVIPAAALLGNDTDPDGDPLTITGVGGATHGSVAFDAVAQTITFTPEAGYTGPAGFTYSIADGREGTASAEVTISVDAPSPYVGLFRKSDRPAVAAVNDPSPVELGVRFESSASGLVTGLRFYKGAANTGPHVGHLWTASGTLLATASFTNESASGWQQVDLAAPVAITAGVGYVASYHTTVGHYSSTPDFFAAPHASGPLSAPAGGNGVFAYGPAGGFPTGSYNNTNYWVDVVFDPRNRAPVAVADAEFTTPQGSPLVVSSTALLGNDTDPDGDPLTITGVDGATHGSVAFDAAAQTITFTPEAGYAGPAGFTYSIADGRGGTASGTAGLTVEPASTAASLFATTDTPAVASVNDPAAVELGVRFQASAGGAVTGIRFYKGAGNTGPHVGHLWTATGTLLATASFTAETASGWQQVDLAAPVNITAGVGYVASYHTASGNYAATPGFFAAPHASGPLSAPAGGNGVYAYGPAGGFPSGSFNNTNYWVDVVFQGQLAA